MSATNESQIDVDGLLFGDEGLAEDNVAMPTIDLIVPYVHSPKDADLPHGLFIKESQIPTDAVIDPKCFKPYTVKYADDRSPSGYREEKGILAERYHLVILGFDHDEHGQPRSWKSEYDGEEKWVIYVLAHIWQCWTEKPFRIKYGGATNAFRMERHLKMADKYIVGAATLERQLNAEKKKVAWNPASRNMFLIPVTHRVEFVGTTKKSWCSAVQEFIPDSVKTATNGGRSGVSVLEQFSKKDATGEPREKLARIMLAAKGEIGKQRLALTVTNTKLYKTALKLVPRGAKGEAAAADVAGVPHFSENPDLQISDEQVADLTNLCLQMGLDVEVEVQTIRGSGKLKGGDEHSLHFSLTEAGYRIFKQHLEARLKAQGQAKRTAPAGPVLDEDDIPF